MKKSRRGSELRVKREELRRRKRKKRSLMQRKRLKSKRK